VKIRRQHGYIFGPKKLVGEKEKNCGRENALIVATSNFSPDAICFEINLLL